MVSILRVGLILAIVQIEVLRVVGPAIFAAAAAFFATGVLLLKRRGENAAVTPLIRSPFELRPLLMFAALFGAVATLNAVLAGYIGAGGLVAVAALSGTVDVDVAVLSTLRLVGTSASATTAGEAVLAALATNALLRLGLAIAAGPRRFWLPLAIGTAFAVSSGAAAFLFLPAI
jgi:uncharacterized membrane protein (DUF4010 family)